MDDLTRMIKAGLEAFAIPHTSTTILHLRNYIELFWSWNSVFRLTAEPTKGDLVKNQLADSLTIYRLLTSTGPLVDIGSGAGFPALVVKLLHPNKEMWLVEAKAHKANFLRDVQRSLGLRDLVIWEGRAEEVIKEESLDSRCRECTTKAFGNLEKFLEISFPLLCDGGSALAMVGSFYPVRNELLSLYSGPIVHKVRNPFKDRKRTILQFSKHC
jgi:16S rRNA (guanine527-N7)-methyltransferase